MTQDIIKIKKKKKKNDYHCGRSNIDQKKF